MIRTAPAVLTAAITTVIVTIGAAVVRYLALLAGLDAALSAFLAPSAVPWPFDPRAPAIRVVGSLLGVVLFAATVAFVTWLGTRGAQPGRGFWPTGLSSWLGAVLGGLLAGSITQLTLLGYYRLSPDGLIPQLLNGISGGAYAGLASGWIIGLAAAVAFALTNRS